MDKGSIQKMYRFYEIFSDFNRIRILNCIADKEKTLEEIADEINLKQPVVLSQLDYLSSYKIVKQEVYENKIIFKIEDKTILKIISQISKEKGKKR